MAAYKVAGDLPDPEEDDYIHETDRRRSRTPHRKDAHEIMMTNTPKDESEYEDLLPDDNVLSDVEESEEDDFGFASVPSNKTADI